jgi:hypothetical protein
MAMFMQQLATLSASCTVSQCMARLAKKPPLAMFSRQTRGLMAIYFSSK